MVIAHVLKSLTVGGIEKVVVDICNNVDLTKHKVYIITLSEEDLQLKSQLNENIKVISLPYKNFSAFGIIFFWFTGLPKLIQIFNEIKPDIVHSHLYYQYLLFLALGIKWSTKKPIHVRTVHTAGLFYDSDTLLNRFRRFVEIISFKIIPTHLIGISKKVYENNDIFFLKHLKNNRLIPNGINLSRFSKSNFKNITKHDFGLNEEKMIVTYVSRLDYGKNHSCLLTAWKEVVAKFPNAHLCLVGDGVLKQTLCEQVQKLGIENDITFFGTLEDVAPVLSVTDVAVFPSQFEGFGISLIEKMAMGLPVVTSDIDVFKEIITHGENGFLCSVNDSNELVSLIVTLLNDRELRLQVGEKAKKRVTNFDINNIVNQTINYYEESFV